MYLVLVLIRVVASLLIRYGRQMLNSQYDAQSLEKGTDELQAVIHPQVRRNSTSDDPVIQRKLRNVENDGRSRRQCCYHCC